MAVELLLCHNLSSPTSRQVTTPDDTLYLYRRVRSIPSLSNVMMTIGLEVTLYDVSQQTLYPHCTL